MLKGINITATLGIKNLHIEGDSKIVIESINHGWLLGWNIRDILLDINLLVSKLERKCLNHTYREGN